MRCWPATGLARCIPSSLGASHRKLWRPRITACDAKLIVTADQAPRGGKATPLKANVE